MTLDLTVISDLHVGAIRSAGTTPVTALRLRQYALEQMQALLDAAAGTHLIINGDLLDTSKIPYSDLLEVYRMLAQWLISNPASTLYLPLGNHDRDKTTSTMSSCQFLVSLLKALLPSRVVSEDRGHAIQVANGTGWIIPHMVNQEQFDIELDAVPEVDYLFVHANYSNHFAVHSDHSLNMSEDQAKKSLAKKIIFGHEHQKKMALSGKVMIIGNQFPTSVADCLGNADKFLGRITEKGLQLEKTWEGGKSFQRVDWREMVAHPDSQFIRVEGEASASEAPAVVTAISKLRKAHSAFVITNAVKIEGRAEMGEMESMETVANFNVTEALMKLLQKKNPAWAAKVAELQKETT